MFFIILWVEHALANIFAGHFVRVLCRRENLPFPKGVDVVKCDVSQPETIPRSAFKDIDVTFSSLGITRQKDGATYEAIDYGANKLILDMATDAGSSCKKFVYTSVQNGQNEQVRKSSHLVDCKERFVDELQSESKIKSVILRPTGFFTDIKEFLDMAKGGRVFLFGDGSHKANPIHPVDLAVVCADACDQDSFPNEKAIGGPETMTHREMARLALRVAGKDENNVWTVPEWLLSASVWLMNKVAPLSISGPLEFMAAIMTRDCIGDSHGQTTLLNYFESEMEKE